jgi:exodeoxyribonuclease VII large subunit
MQAREHYAQLSAPAAFARMRDNLNLRQQRLDELSFRMEAAWRGQLLAAAQRLQHLTSSALRYDMSHRILLVRERFDALTARLLRAYLTLANSRRAGFEALEKQLLSLSPLGVLNRGYAVVYDESGALMRNAAGAKPGQLLSARLAHGTIQSRVVKTFSE